MTIYQHTQQGDRPHPMMSTEGAYRQQVERFGTVLARSSETMTWQELIAASIMADEAAAHALEQSAKVWTPR